MPLKCFICWRYCWSELQQIQSKLQLGINRIAIIIFKIYIRMWTHWSKIVNCEEKYCFRILDADLTYTFYFHFYLLSLNKKITHNICLYTDFCFLLNIHFNMKIYHTHNVLYDPMLETVLVSRQGRNIIFPFQKSCTQVLLNLRCGSFKLQVDPYFYTRYN